MKISELKKMLKEAVKEAFQEEIREIILEAVKTPIQPSLPPNSYPQVVNEYGGGYVVPSPTNAPMTQPPSPNNFREQYAKVISESNGGVDPFQSTPSYNPVGAHHGTVINGELPAGEVSLDQIMNLGKPQH